jgi:thiol-disulfide isomerase/thioredoxin
MVRFGFTQEGRRTLRHRDLRPQDRERANPTLERVTSRTRSRAKHADVDRAQKSTVRRRPAPRKRAALPRWTPWAGSAVVVVVIAIAVVFRSVGSATITSEADPTVVAGVTTVPASTLDAVAAPDGLRVPKALPPSVPQVTQDGKPVVLYVGAEYCPFCAAERWPIVVALSRFGTFSHLGQTESAGSPEAFPNTPTLSFHGASYASPYLAFQGVETQSNQGTSTGFEPLDTLTPEQRQLLQMFDVRPYVAAAGAIPFVLIGNRFVFEGSQYVPTALQGSTAEQIAASLRDPTSQRAMDIDGSANILAAAICDLTSQQPAAVCTSDGVRAAASILSG